MQDLSQLPPAVIGLLAVLVVVQIGLEVFALVDLVRRDRVVGGRKWVWAVVILFVNLVGAVIYLAVGRNVPAEAADPLAEAAPDARDRVERAADTLYGQR